MTDEGCAIAGWEYRAGQVKMYVRVKPRGQEAIDIVRQMIDWRLNDITIDTLRDGVFRIDTHEREFYNWCAFKEPK